MSIVPNVSASVLSKATQVWEAMINQHGKDIVLSDMEGALNKTVKAFVKRPKILGLFDRTEQSFDQEKYQLLLKASDFTAPMLPEKFLRATWAQEDHVFISVTEVELNGTVFGYRVLVKG